MMPGAIERTGRLLNENFRRLIVKRRILMSMSFLGIVLLLAGGLAWPSPRQPQQASGEDAAMEIVLIAPTGARMSIEELAPGFEAKTGYKIKGTYAASGLIKKKVIDGDSFDVSLLLMPIADALATGNLVESSVKPLASVPIALAIKKGAPKPDVSTPEALKQTLLSAKAISYPHGAPGALSAVLVDNTLNKLGITDQILPKVKPGGTGAVVKGDVDFALAFQNEINDPGVEIDGPLPAAVSTPAPMVGAISSHAKNPAIAKQLLEYLATPAAKAVYKSMGMVPAS
jgi:molybdate transport system substrate-binding protein